MMAGRWSRIVFCTLAAAIAVACSRHDTPRYVVTNTPIGVGLYQGFCIAVDPADSTGVWWWETGGRDCRTRSTGPTVFHAERAAVSPGQHAGTTDVRFRIQLKRAPGSTEPGFTDVWLVLDGDRLMRSPVAATQVTTARRKDLDIPESWR